MCLSEAILFKNEWKSEKAFALLPWPPWHWQEWNWINTNKCCFPMGWLIKTKFKENGDSDFQETILVWTSMTWLKVTGHVSYKIWRRMISDTRTLLHIKAKNRYVSNLIPPLFLSYSWDKVELQPWIVATGIKWISLRLCLYSTMCSCVSLLLYKSVWLTLLAAVTTIRKHLVLLFHRRHNPNESFPCISLTSIQE